MAGVRQGNFLMLRSHHCGNKDCLKYMSQCMALQAIEKGRTGSYLRLWYRPVSLGTQSKGQVGII